MINPNIAEYLSKRAQAHPADIAIIDPKIGVHLTYEELNDLKDRWIGYFEKKGIIKGMRTLVMIRPGVELIAVTFALLEIGAIPIMIDPGMGIKDFLSCVKRSEPEALVGIPIAHWVGRIFRKSFRRVRIRVLVRKGEIPKDLGYRKAPVETKNIEGDIAGIVFTSGSTGAPKGVVYTHKIFNEQIRLLKDVFKIQPGEVDFAMLPIFTLFNPALGITTIVPDMNPSRPANADAAKIVHYLNKYYVTNSFGSPVIWKKIADYCEKENVKLLSLKRILMAGCSVPTSLVERYTKIAPNAVVHTPYGATEALPITSLTTQEIIGDVKDERHVLHEAGKGTRLGKAVDGVEIKIIKRSEEVLRDFQDIEELKVNEVGEIIVKGPIVTEYYDRLPDATAKTKIADNGKIWHRMGDLGYMDDEGVLWFCGRKAEVVLTKRGAMYTDCCEGIINQHPKVSRSALIGLGNGGNEIPAIVIEPKIGEWPLRRKHKNEFLKEVKNLAKSSEVTKDIEHFYLYKNFPVDVRHNAKIHRLTLKKKFCK